MSRDYTKLKAFQQANELALDIYGVTDTFPKHEIFGLTSQIRRAAVSVPANIVEGSFRFSLKEYIHFLSIAFSSLAEVGFFLDFSLKIGYLDDINYQNLHDKQLVCLKTLNALIMSLKRKDGNAFCPKPNA